MNVEELLLLALAVIVVALARWATRPRATELDYAGYGVTFSSFSGRRAVVAKYDRHTGTMTFVDARAAAEEGRTP